MMGWLWGAAALAWLTVVEAMRQRLWLLFVAAVAGLVLQAPSLQAVDKAAQLKLAVVTITGAISFVITLLAILVAATALRRDLDARTGFLLFSKPLARSAYLCGRWAGVLGGLLTGILGLCVVGALTILWQFRAMPEMRRVIAPVDWEQVSAYGQATPIDEAKERIQLSGAPGNGVRFRFSSLPAAGPDGLEVLVHLAVRGYDPDITIEEALVQVTALASGSAPGASPQLLLVDSASPYGRTRGDQPVAPGHAVVRDRDQSRIDLAADYLRLRLPASCIGVDGGATIQLVRLESRAALLVQRGTSLRVAVPGGSFFANLVRAGLVLLAGASLLASWTLVCAVIANVGVTTLGGLTLFFAGSAMPAMREVISYNEASVAGRRLMELSLQVLPDFERFGVAARLAASEAVDWSMVAAAWSYYGLYAGGFLVLTWLLFLRREL
jgi:ABC-type transport system involved in multi-copper enzyme maturation permease subunit